MYRLETAGFIEPIPSKETVATIVDRILVSALDQGASDIHCEPAGVQMRVRFRLNGMLYDQAPIRSRYSGQVIARLKVLAHLDIAQTRLPQDGKLQLVYGARSIDLRIATFPTTQGEKLVIRLLDRSRMMLKLAQLGFDLLVYEQLLQIMRRQEGFLLVSGPTGSGKTTSLYAMLMQVHDAHKNIVTMEDPVEYTIAGITQTQVNPAAGLSFENGLRSLLRQDPDILMIGEIRDSATLQIATQAALTGHFVLSTVHASTALGVVFRLQDMGLAPDILHATLQGVLAQRLLRRLCDSCKKPCTAPSSLYKRIEARVIYVAHGCRDCQHTGYSGRMLLAELLVFSHELHELIRATVSIAQLHAYLEEQKIRTLHDVAVDALVQGRLSLQDYYTIAPHDHH